MKGPYERLKYDFRRTFECPKCHRRVRAPGHITFVFCNCRADTPDRNARTLMRLIDDNERHPRVVSANHSPPRA